MSEREREHRYITHISGPSRIKVHACLVEGGKFSLVVKKPYKKVTTSTHQPHSQGHDRKEQGMAPEIPPPDLNHTWRSALAGDSSYPTLWADHTMDQG